MGLLLSKSPKCGVTSFPKLRLVQGSALLRTDSQHIQSADRLGRLTILVRNFCGQSFLSEEKGFSPQVISCSLNHQKLSTAVLINTGSYFQSPGEKLERCSRSIQHLGAPLPPCSDPDSSSRHPLQAAGTAGMKDAPNESTPCLTGQLQPPKKAVCFCSILYAQVLFALECSAMNIRVYKLTLLCFNLNCKISLVSPAT